MIADTSPGDSVVLLSPSAPGLSVAKCHRRTEAGDVITVQYPSVKRWHVASVTFDNSFASFANLLTAVTEMGRYVAIRGAPNAGIDETETVLRRIHASPTTGEPAFFHATPRRWAMIDYDNLPNSWGDPTDAVEVEALLTAIVVSTLPSEFHNAKFWWQWSNSMLIGDVGWNLLNVHLWFMLRNPVADDVLSQWAEQSDAIDEAVFRAVQPHYLAPPQFINMVDPLPDRYGIAERWATDDCVDFAYVPQSAAAVLERKAMQVAETQREWREAGHFVMPIMSGASAPMQRIAEIGVAGRLHMPIVRSAASWIVSCGASPDCSAWKALVKERCAVSGNPHRHARASNLYLDAVWRSAVNKFSPFNPLAPKVPPELIINNNRF